MFPSRFAKLFIPFVLVSLWQAPSVGAQALAFMGSQVCGNCHANELQLWKDSHHGWALREPAPANVLGDFNDARFEIKGITTRFFTKDGRYYVETDGADGKLATFEIKYVVGITPLQQYLVQLDRGKLQALDIAWDTVAKRWFHLYPDEDVSAGNGLHWTGVYKNWQARCAVCHQTDFRKNYDPETRTYDSKWSELTVGCETCHGPGEAHVKWAETHKAVEDASENLDAIGFLRPKGHGKQENEVNICGPCHSRREALEAHSTLPVAHYGDNYKLSTLDWNVYFADGQQEAEDYVLGSFMQSKMYQKGVTCTNCHDPHSGKLVGEGNAVCTQCHNETGREEFPSLKLADYDSPAHYHHPKGSAGAQCVSCHMPERTFMQVDGRRDHFFRNPDPLLSQKVNSPDTCLSCHTGKDAGWAAAEIHKWLPEKVLARSVYAELFDAVRNEGLDRARLGELAQLAGDPSKPAIVRATALREIEDQADEATVRDLSGLLSDESDLVRSTAVRIWRAMPNDKRLVALQPLLSDPIRSVRIAAALELTSISQASLTAEQNNALGAALAELRSSMHANADFPEGQMAIGGLAMTTRNWTAAEAAFAEAVFLDPQLVQAWLARASIAQALGNLPEATSILLDARKSNPDEININAQLVQLLLRQGRQSEAIPILKDIISANPSDEDVRITLALALLRTNDLSGAEAEIDLLRATAPYRAEVLLLRGLLQVSTGDFAAAKETVKEIKSRYPNLRLPPPLEELSRLP